MRVAKPIKLGSDDDRRLQTLSKRKRVKARVQIRSHIVLLAAAGMMDKDIAQKLDIGRRVVARWRTRFLAAGVDGLFQDATRPSRSRTLAAHIGTSASAVACIWRAHGLKSHRVESFKLSNDTHFIEKFEDIVGLYLDPPEHALVLC